MKSQKGNTHSSHKLKYSSRKTDERDFDISGKKYSTGYSSEKNTDIDIKDAGRKLFASSSKKYDDLLIRDSPAKEYHEDNQENYDPNRGEKGDYEDDIGMLKLVNKDQILNSDRALPPTPTYSEQNLMQ